QRRSRERKKLWSPPKPENHRNRPLTITTFKPFQQNIINHHYSTKQTAIKETKSKQKQNKKENRIEKQRSKKKETAVAATTAVHRRRKSESNHTVAVRHSAAATLAGSLAAGCSSLPLSSFLYVSR
ncbi:hypothetical protein A2U01_0021546, partial [Trifolium medium]|nr:hypothetical protein [Trifolium medium]